MNKLICGDNLEVLATMDKESVDLIYIDPPFFSFLINLVTVQDTLDKKFSVVSNTLAF